MSPYCEPNAVGAGRGIGILCWLANGPGKEPITDRNRQPVSGITDDESEHRQDLQRDRRIAAWKQQARRAARAKSRRNLYVITLHPDVMDHEAFCEANPRYVEGMPCVYVGLTIHQPGDRYEQHKTGYRSSKYPRRYGIELALDLIEGFEDEGLEDADRETGLAAWLRAQGYGVWQN